MPLTLLALWLIFFTMAGTVIQAAPALCAPSAPGSGDAVGRIMLTQEKLSSINRRIEKETFLAEQTSQEDRVGHHQKLTRLQEIKFIYQRLLYALKRNITLSSEEAGFTKSIENGQAYLLAEQKPYSLSYYDKLLDRVAAVEQKKTDLRVSIQSAELKLAEYRENLQQAQRSLRRIKEEVAENNSALPTGDLKYDRGNLEQEAATGILELQKAKLTGLTGELRIVVLKQQAAQQKLAIIKNDLSFDPAAIDLETARLETQRANINARLQSFLDEQRKVELEWRTDRTKATGPEIEIALKSREAWQEAYEAALGQTEDMVHLINTQEKLWKYRYTLVKSKVAGKERDQWEKEASAVRKHTRQASGLYQNRQIEVQSQISAMEKKLRDTAPIRKKYLAFHLDALKRTGDFGDDYFSTLLATGQLAGRLMEEIANGTKATFIEKILTSGFKFDEIWNFELWVIDEHGVTVKKVLTALVILIIGILVVKRVIKSLAARLSRAKFEAGAVAWAEKTLLYGGFILVVLLALRIVNIPLTAFTFMGGAIAIGIGFGAQNLINNFISGFIIMAERPIRIGDLIELEGRCVRVQEIGARCTKVKTVENIHILVPNSSFLEKNITNWTLSDKMIRARLTVGVAYGSRIDRVTELLLEAAGMTDPILKTPHPFVIFEEFGDSSLVFAVHYWQNVDGMIHREQIASALRYQISDLFNTHGIVIAFPQRDIHLKAAEPLQIQLSQPIGQTTGNSLNRTLSRNGSNTVNA